jgi:hypothetical protein
MAQFVFIDDSGDPGFKLDKGSSKHFVIACVIFDDNLDAEETALKIKKHRRMLGWRDDREFKFNKSSRVVRLQFLNEVKDCNFRIRAIVADKSLIRSNELRGNKHSFYNYMIKEVLANSSGTIADAKVRLDGHEDRAYKKAATTYFRKELSSKNSIVKQLRFVNSATDNLIQLADMVAGSVLRSMQSDKTDCAEYLGLLKARIEDIWYFK